MATQEVVKTLWKNWCSLTNEDRDKVASHLGSVGRILSIAANVQNIAIVPPEEKGERSEESIENKKRAEDEDIIEVDFEET